MTDAPSPARPARWQAATIAAIETRTATVKSFFLQPAQPFVHRAGQHVDVRLTAPDGYTAQRSYSIASAPGAAGAIEIAVDLLPDGEVSPFFHEVAAVGDAIELRGPLGGHFVWDARDGGPLLLVAGGSGVVPLACMARHRADVPCALLYAARAWDGLVFRDELIGFAGRSDGFSLRFTTTREPPRRAGDFGRRVDAAMVADTLALLPAPPRLVFCCGSNGFVNSATDAIIAAGVAPEIVRTERYGG